MNQLMLYRMTCHFIYLWCVGNNCRLCWYTKCLDGNLPTSASLTTKVTLFTSTRPNEPTSHNYSREDISVALDSSVLKRFNCNYIPNVISQISLYRPHQLSERKIAANLHQKRR